MNTAAYGGKLYQKPVEAHRLFDCRLRLGGVSGAVPRLERSAAARHNGVADRCEHNALNEAALSARRPNTAEVEAWDGKRDKLSTPAKGGSCGIVGPCTWVSCRCSKRDCSAGNEHTGDQNDADAAIEHVSSSLAAA